MTGAMTIGELVLGLAAWSLGFAALFLRGKKAAARLCGMGSMACCAVFPPEEAPCVKLKTTRI